MDINDLLETLSTKMESIFDNGNYFKEQIGNADELYKEEIYNAALSDGFPLVDPEEIGRLDYDIQYANDMGFDDAFVDLADDYIEKYQLDMLDNEEQQAYIQDDARIGNYMIENLPVYVEISFNTDIYEYLDRYPDIDYVETQVISRYNESELINELNQNPEYIREHIQEQLDDLISSGEYPEHTTLDDIDYRIDNISREVVESVISNCMNGVYGSSESTTVSKWLDELMLIDMAEEIQQDSRLIEITITTDPEDLDE